MNEEEYEEGLVPVPICEICWLIEHTIWEPESVGSDGRVLMRLMGVDVPEKINTGGTDICNACGAITIAGIYELKNAMTLLAEDDNGKPDWFDHDPTKFIFTLYSEDDGYDDKYE